MAEEEWNFFVELDKAIKAEDLANKKLKKLAKKLAKDCRVLWKMGDGDGGYIINVIKESFYQDIGRPAPRIPGKRKPISNSKRKIVFERNAYRCVYCGGYKSLVIDHILPVSLGGTNDLDNLQTLCHSCNSAKSNKV